MIEKLQQRMTEEIAKLPNDRQVAISTLDWGTISEEIAKERSIVGDDLDSFQLETGLVILGLVTFDKYIRNIENNVGLSKEEAKEISEVVLNRIFIPIINKLESIAKNNLDSKTPSWDQTVNFIISGGDYSNFI